MAARTKKEDLSIDSQFYALHQSQENLHAHVQEVMDTVRDGRMEIRTVRDRVDGIARRQDELAEAYLGLDKALNNHLQHMGWGQIGSSVVQVLGFMAILGKMMGWF